LFKLYSNNKENQEKGQQVGNPTPDKEPEIEVTLWYKVTLDAFQDPGLVLGCNGLYMGPITCCVDGNTLKGWVIFGMDCVNTTELCAFTGFTAQLLLNAIGPYDLYTECMAS